MIYLFFRLIGSPLYYKKAVFEQKRLEFAWGWLVLVLAFAFFQGTTCAYGELPWSIADQHDVVESFDLRPSHPAKLSVSSADSMAETVCFMFLKLYQDGLSSLGTVKCPMHPSCSNYCIQTIRKHGAPIGIMMTAERLIHEADEKKHAPMIRAYGKLRFFDPVAANDFWWAQSEK
ncbi:MAG: membrane protein insertion efficiency factor YidD [Lentisphaerae bacterium]|nr:membrane protein insertion efficiency factor YidD [Lentisphaerota bacterium]